MRIVGVIKSIVVREITTKESEVVKVADVHVEEQGEQYPNALVLGIYGTEKVEKFEKYNKVGQLKDIEFKSRVNEYNGKLYTKLTLWNATKVEEQEADGGAFA